MPTVGGGVTASNLFLPVSADERTWQCSIPIMQNENGFNPRGILLIKPLFISSDWDHAKTHSIVGDFHVFSKGRRCLLLWLRAQFWLPTKIAYVAIYATIFYVKPEKFFILFFKFPHRCGNHRLLLFTDFKHASLNPMVEKCIDLSPV